VRVSPLPSNKLTVTIRTRLTCDQFVQLQAIAHEDSSTVSHVVRRIVVRKLRADRVQLDQGVHGAA